MGAPISVERVVVLVGVLASRVQASGRVSKDAVEVTGGGIELITHAGQRKSADQTRMVLQHLLEMRHTPVLRGRVAEEAALDVVVRSAAGHLLERVHGHRPQLWVGPQLRLLEQHEDRVGLRKLGRGAKASVLRVVGVLDRVENLIDDGVVE